MTKTENDNLIQAIEKLQETISQNIEKHSTEKEEILNEKRELKKDY
jgi:hypothetical protein